jgi:hypothetical protein
MKVAVHVALGVQLGDQLSDGKKQREAIASGARK